MLIFCAGKARRAIPMTANTANDRTATFLFRWIRKTEPVFMTVGVLVEELNLLGWIFVRCPWRFFFFTEAPQ